GTWDEAYSLAKTMVSQLALDERVNIITDMGSSIHNTHSVPRLGIPSLCFNDGPAGVCLVENFTGFPAGIN
ncbi:glycoside hydrolase family 3 protein, partial [Amanita thiersii Skay4041]